MCYVPTPLASIRSRLGQEESGGVLDVALDDVQEGDGLAAVDEAVVVGDGDVHHGADLELAVDDDGALLDSVHVEDGGLGVVDDGGAEEGAEDAGVGDGEVSALEVGHGELAVASL